MKDITIEEAVKMLDKFITEHKFYNIKQSDGLEDNIEKVLNELDTLQNGFNTAVEHQTELIRENSHLRYELFNNQKELEKKDKIIDAMIEWIENEQHNKIDDDNFYTPSTFMLTKEEIKEYFEKEVKDNEC